MINEKGAIQVKTVMNDEVTRELNKTNYILAIVNTVLGSVFLVGYIIGYTIFGSDDTIFDGWFGLFVMGVFLLTMGVLVIISHNKNIKVMRQKQQVEELEFYGDYIICREYEFGEQISVNKIYYSRAVRTKETTSFIFIYNTNVTAIAVDKRTVPPNELMGIRSLLSKVGKTVYNGPINSAPVAPAPSVAPPPDPFDSARTEPEQSENKPKSADEWTEVKKEEEQPADETTEVEQPAEMTEDEKPEDGGQND